jgi:SagB-type dehydrogenase family enzyme
MKLRRAASLTMSYEAGEIVVTNFLTRDRFTCSAECVAFLAHLDDWHPAKELFRYFPGTDGDNLADQVAELVGLNALIVEGTPLAKQDEVFRREWLWGPAAGWFHFSVRNTRFVTGPPAREFMRKRRSWRPSPPLYQSNRGRHITKLPRTDLAQEPFALMRRRRSQRDFTRDPITLGMLSDCLFAGNGIVEFAEDKDYGRLPLAMTPSGGARNPYELYVYARNVTDLEPGFHHYDALHHNLGLVRSATVNVPDMLGTQKWPAKAAAIIFLVAHFPRTMWKYHLPMAYRIVMMEAGFICQNIALAATHHELSAVPSGAIKESVIESYLGTPPLESAVLFTISIGKVKPYVRQPAVRPRRR